MKHGLYAHVETVGSCEEHGERCWHVIGRILFLGSQGADSCRCLSLEDYHCRHASSLYIREQLTDCPTMTWNDLEDLVQCQKELRVTLG